MSESPQSEFSVALGASGTLTFLIFGGRAGGVGSKRTFGSAPRCWGPAGNAEATEVLSRNC